MSRPISISNSRNVDHVSSPGDSLVRSIGALRIVENVCSSPVSIGNRVIGYNKQESYPETPEFHISSFLNQGGRVIGENAQHAFGTPTSSCFCCNPPAPPIMNNPWANVDQPIMASKMNYATQNVGLNIQPPNCSTIRQQNFYPPCNTTFGGGGGCFYNDPIPQQVMQVVNPTMMMPPNLQQPMIHPSMMPVPFREVPAVSDDLLGKYRANPTAMKSLKLSDIRGNLLKFAKDQVGSRFIQQKLEYSDINEKDAIFEEVVENASELVDDIFGNYVVQKFFEYGEPKHWNRLVEAIIDRVPLHAFQMYACRVLQKALEKVDEPLQIRILNQVRDIILKCIKDQNGNHVIQKAVEKVSPAHIQFVIDVLLQDPDTVYEMSVDPYGCRVVQRVLEYCIEEQTRPIIVKLLQRFDEICNNQYGNYVIQHVLLHGSEENKIVIIQRIASNLFVYATHKYSSNVIEKCLECGSVFHKSLIVKAACFQPERSQPILVQMMKDQYANYVVQKMFDQVTNDQRRELTTTVKPHIPCLRQFTYGKHILAKLEKYFQRSPTNSSVYTD